jgi:hypothetical protein
MKENSRLKGIVALLVEKHGIRAPSVVRHEALRARQSGDIERATEWLEASRLAEIAFTEDL